MPDPPVFAYFYIDPKNILKQDCGGKEFLKEKINSHISIINCLKTTINSCVDCNEIENLRHCLAKLRSGIAELNISAMNDKINELIKTADNYASKEMLSSKLRDFLMICEFVVIDLNHLKENSGIPE
jgi:hypothetical protein